MADGDKDILPTLMSTQKPIIFKEIALDGVGEACLETKQGCQHGPNQTSHPYRHVGQ